MRMRKTGKTAGGGVARLVRTRPRSGNAGKWAVFGGRRWGNGVQSQAEIVAAGNGRKKKPRGEPGLVVGDAGLAANLCQVWID